MMLRSMVSLRPWILAILALVLLPVSEALADCTDPPGPGVNWRRCVFDRLEFRNVDLTAAELRDASFFRADLSGSTFERVKAFRAKFVNAVLIAAVFPEADLREADLTKADLSDANLAPIQQISSAAKEVSPSTAKAPIGL